MRYTDIFIETYYDKAGMITCLWLTKAIVHGRPVYEPAEGYLESHFLKEDLEAFIELVALEPRWVEGMDKHGFHVQELQPYIPAILWEEHSDYCLARFIIERKEQTVLI